MDDADGFAAFYAHTRVALYRALTATLGDAQLAAEAADEALVRAAERWQKVGQMSRPDGWAYRVGVNWATSWRRKWVRRPTLPASALDRDHLDPSTYDFLDALSDLPRLQRQAIVLRYMLHYSTSETADALDVAEGTVKSALHRARRHLADRQYQGIRNGH